MRYSRSPSSVAPVRPLINLCSRSEGTDHLPLRRDSEEIPKSVLIARRLFPAAGEARPYVDAHRASGFHPVLHDETVRPLPKWRLECDGEDLVLSRNGEHVDRFLDGAAQPPDGWFDALRASGYCLLIVGSGLGLERPHSEHIQRALRSGRAIMGLVEFDER